MALFILVRGILYDLVGLMRGTARQLSPEVAALLDVIRYLEQVDKQWSSHYVPLDLYRPD